MKRREVLILDDSPDQLQVLEAMLKKRGYQTVSFLDPAKALEDLKERKPGLILCDFNMPDMNGLEFCRDVRSNGLFENGFFLLVTMDRKPGQEEEDFHDLPDGWISKTIGRDEFMDTVDRWYSMLHDG